MMPGMSSTIRLAALFLLAGCATWPDGWVDPSSSQGVHDRDDKDLVSYGGQRYRIQWRGNPKMPEQSLWLLDGDELSRQVVPWGAWRSLRVTDDEHFFVRDRESRAWLRHRPGQPMTEMPGWDWIWTATSNGFHGHYVRLADQAGILRIAADGTEVGRAAGDDFEMTSGGVLIRRGKQLLDFVDRDLRSLTDKPLEALRVASVGDCWLVHTAKGFRLATHKKFVGGGPFADLQPLLFGDSKVATGWLIKEHGKDTFRIANSDLSSMTSPEVLAIEQATALDVYSYSKLFKRVVVARTPEKQDPLQAMLWGDDLRVISKGDDLAKVVEKARYAMFEEQKAIDDRKAAERRAEHERALAALRAKEQAERDRKAQQAREHRERIERAAQVRREFHAALVKGGIPRGEITRFERDGVPMVVVGGKAYAGYRLATESDARYKRMLSWVKAPKCFLWWDGKHWRSAIKVNTGDDVERVLCKRDGRLQALQKGQLSGKYVVPVAANELLERCARCDGNGIEQRWHKVAEYNRVAGWYWAERKLQVGTLARQGSFVKSNVFHPNACNRCWGHGVVPHLPK